MTPDAKLKELWPERDPDEPSFASPKRPQTAPPGRARDGAYEGEAHRGRGEGVGGADEGRRDQGHRSGTFHGRASGETASKRMLEEAAKHGLALRVGRQ